MGHVGAVATHSSSVDEFAATEANPAEHAGRVLLHTNMRLDVACVATNMPPAHTGALCWHTTNDDDVAAATRKEVLLHAGAAATHDTRLETVAATFKNLPGQVTTDAEHFKAVEPVASLTLNVPVIHDGTKLTHNRRDVAVASAARYWLAFAHTGRTAEHSRLVEAPGCTVMYADASHVVRAAHCRSEVVVAACEMYWSAVQFLIYEQTVLVDGVQAEDWN